MPIYYTKEVPSKFSRLRIKCSISSVNKLKIKMTKIDRGKLISCIAADISPIPWNIRAFGQAPPACPHYLKATFAKENYYFVVIEAIHKITLYSFLSCLGSFPCIARLNSISNHLVIALRPWAIEHNLDPYNIYVVLKF